jgi:hypothetical protein
MTTAAMSTDDLQERFGAALRRALGMMAGDAPAGAAVVTVAAPNVSVSPRVVAELPALPQPLAVVDLQRFAGNFEWQVTPVRGPDGLMTSAKLTPIAFVHFEG